MATDDFFTDDFSFKRFQPVHKRLKKLSVHTVISLSYTTVAHGATGRPAEGHSGVLAVA